jgi:hypothetical protein
LGRREDLRVVSRRGDWRVRSLIREAGEEEMGKAVHLIIIIKL